MIKEAESLKAALQSAQSSYAEICRQIAADATWAWTQAGKKAQLDNASDAIKVKLSAWQKDWLFAKTPFQKMKSKFTKDRWLPELTQFKEFKPLIEKLATVCESALEAHSKIVQG